MQLASEQTCHLPALFEKEYAGSNRYAFVLVEGSDGVMFGITLILLQLLLV